MSKTIHISDENAEWLKTICNGSFNDAILILKKKKELSLEEYTNTRIKENEYIFEFLDSMKLDIEAKLNMLLLKPKDVVTPAIQDAPKVNKTIDNIVSEKRKSVIPQSELIKAKNEFDKIINDDIELPKSLINEITKAYEGMTHSDQLIANAIERAKEKVKEKESLNNTIDF